MAAKSNTELMAKMEKANGVNGHKPPSVADSVRLALERMKDQIAMALPRHVTPDRLCRTALTSIRTNPKLLECTIESLLACTMQSAQLGLEPGILGHVYYMPFKRKIKGENGQPDKWVDEVQFIIGYKGLIDLARRSGQIISVAAGAIYSKDKFKYRKGFEEVLEHEPNFQDRGELCGFYAYATTKDGGRYAEVMTLQDINKIRARSKAKDFGPWVTDYEEMAKKTVLRRLCKLLPLSIEIASQISTDESKEFGADVTAIDLNLGDDKPLLVEEISTTKTARSEEEIIAELDRLDAQAAQEEV